MYVYYQCLRIRTDIEKRSLKLYVRLVRLHLCFCPFCRLINMHAEFFAPKWPTNIKRPALCKPIVKINRAVFKLKRQSRVRALLGKLCTFSSTYSLEITRLCTYLCILKNGSKNICIIRGKIRTCQIQKSRTFFVLQPGDKRISSKSPLLFVTCS